jgi:hypothetical protein
LDHGFPPTTLDIKYLINAPTGTIRYEKGALDNGSLNNQGHITLIGGSTFSGTTPSINSGVIELIGGGASFNNGLINGTAGVIRGVGGIGTPYGILRNEGTIAPGSPIGTIGLSGRFEQPPNGVIKLDFASATQYDRITDGPSYVMDIQGTLACSLIKGYEPAAGTAFDVISGETRIGAINALDNAYVGGLPVLSVDELPSDIVLRVLDTGVTLTPLRGGDTGTVLINVTGSMIHHVASLRLTRTGEPDIVGTDLSGSILGTSASAVFDLQNRSRGTWDMVVERSGESPIVTPAAFAIEAGSASDVQVTAEAPRRVTPCSVAANNECLPLPAKSRNRLDVILANRGNVDAIGNVRLTMSAQGPVGTWDVHWVDSHNRERTVSGFGEVPPSITLPDMRVPAFGYQKITHFFTAGPSDLNTNLSWKVTWF